MPLFLTAIINSFVRVLAAALAILPLLLICACKDQTRSAASPPPRGPVELSWPEKGAYTGAYVDFGEAEDKVTLEAIDNFEAKAGKHQAIIASSSFWGEQNFPAGNAGLINRYGAVPLIFWSPWDRPYKENQPPDRFSLRAILAGEWDGYIDLWADGAKAFGKPMLVSWGLEMNGQWFPWSGFHYGGGRAVPGAEPAQFEGPELFKRAFRHVVDRVRARGVRNILWGFHVNNSSYPSEAWNGHANYYPGGDYVDWLGLSVYGMQFNWQQWGDFPGEMNGAYRELCALDPAKPVVVAEWGVGEFPRAGDKAAWLLQAFTALTTRYTRVKAAVYWHERWRNEDDSYSNLRINSSPEALAAYRQGVAGPHWLDRPQYRPR